MQTHNIPATIRLPAQLLAKLKTLAHERSLSEKRDIRWTEIAKQSLMDAANLAGEVNVNAQA